MSKSASLTSELASMTRMFHAACDALGLISEALGLDPDDGGAEPILDAIAELKGETLTTPSPISDQAAGEPSSANMYVWFAENKGNERDGERFIRAWTGDVERVPGLRKAIGKEPTIYRSTAPTTGSAPEIASGPCLIVKGSGETDLPIVHIVHSIEEARHAVLSLMYSDPADAEDTETLFEEFDDELTDGNYWSIAFEIGGISVERVCLDVALLAASTGGEKS